MRTVLVVVVGLVLLLVIGDRVGVTIAENQVAETMQQSSHLAAKPDVDISGFPFLTQLASKDFDQVTITAEDVPLGTSSVHVDAHTLRAVMDDVKIASDLHSVTITHGTADAVVSYAQISQALSPVHVSYAGGNKVHASVAVGLPGLGNRTLGVDLSPGLVGDALNFGVSTITGVPDFLLGRAEDLIGSSVGKHIPLDRIPFGLQVKAIHAGSAGIVVQLVGDHVTLRRG